MSKLTAPQVRGMARGETNTLLTDWGENTAGSETGVLKAGDTVSSCTIAVAEKPSGADDPTLGSVTVPGTSGYVNGRSCSTGEWTQVNVTTASDQAYGTYRLKLTATTANGKVLPRYVTIEVRGS